MVSTGACFGHVVHVDCEILRTLPALAAAAVHGIRDEEILASPPFTTVWQRFLDFVESVLNNHIDDSDGHDDSEEEEPRPARPPEEPPLMLVGAHNGYMCFLTTACMM